MDEISQLQNYLAAGGKLLLTSSVYAQTPQLDAVLAQFGLARAEGMVVEGDSGKALYNSAWSLLPDYGTPTESTALNGVNTNTHVMLSVAQGITITETEDVTAEPLLNSSSSAYAKVDINDLTLWSGRKGTQMAPLRWPSGHGTRIPAPRSSGSAVPTWITSSFISPCPAT